MSFDGRPEENPGQVIEDLFRPIADGTGSAGRLWKEFRMKPRGVLIEVGVRWVKRHVYDVLSCT